MDHNAYQLHFRLPGDIGKNVDGYIRFVKESTGADLSRTDAVLALVRKGLEGFPAKGRAK